MRSEQPPSERPRAGRPGAGFGGGGDGDTRRPATGAAAVESGGDREAAHQAQSFVRHELRTPLAVLQPVVDMLLGGAAGELEARQRDYVAMLERNAARLAGMISSVVETGWLEVAAVPVEEQEVDVAALVRELVQLVPSEAEEAPAVTIRVDDAVGEAGAAVRTDPHRLRLALRNVLLNACRFTAASGQVAIQVRREADRIVTEVADTGCGIPGEELPRVFELGFQGAAAAERQDRGLGLGLAVTRTLIERAGGSVAVTSEAGRGTTVAVTLPASS